MKLVLAFSLILAVVTAQEPQTGPTCLAGMSGPMEAPPKTEVVCQPDELCSTFYGSVTVNGTEMSGAMTGCVKAFACGNWDCSTPEALEAMSNNSGVAVTSCSRFTCCYGDRCNVPYRKTGPTCYAGISQQGDASPMLVKINCKATEVCVNFYGNMMINGTNQAGAISGCADALTCGTYDCSTPEAVAAFRNESGLDVTSCAGHQCCHNNECNMPYQGPLCMEGFANADAGTYTEKRCKFGEVCSTFYGSGTFQGQTYTGAMMGCTVPEACGLNCSTPVFLAGVQDSLNGTGIEISTCKKFDCCITGESCNVPVLNGTSCPIILENDLPLFSKCSLRTAYEKATSCMSVFFKHAPFTSTDTCKSKYVEASHCFADVLTMCQEGFCDSLFAFIPGSHKMLKMMAEHLKQSSAEMSTKVCSMESMEEMMNGMMQMMGSMSQMESSVCDATLMEDMGKWSKELMKKHMEAKTHEDICSSTEQFYTMLITAVKSRCNFEKIRDLISQPLLAEYLIKMSNIVIDLISNDQVPGCEGPKCIAGITRMGETTPKFMKECRYNEVCSTFYGTINMNGKDEAGALTGCIVKEACGAWDCSTPAGVADMRNSSGLNITSCDRFECCSKEGCNVPYQGPMCYEGAANATDGYLQEKRCQFGEDCSTYYVSGFDEQGNAQKGAFLGCQKKDICSYDCSAPEFIAGLKNASGYDVRTCEKSSCCSDNLCNVPVMKDPACPTIMENDLPLFSNCTLRSTYEKGARCMAIFMMDAPFQSEYHCKNRFMASAHCMAEVMTACQGGFCESLFAYIPGARATIAMVAEGMRSAAPMIADQVCSGKVLEQLLSGVQPPFGIGEPVCDNMVLDDMHHWVVMLVKQHTEATTHADLCKTTEDFFSKVVEAAKTRCNLERIRDLVPHPELGEYLVKMSNIIIDLISNDQVPGCEAEVTMVQCPEVPESACGRQLNEAWLCDYISWRITFMHKWAPKFLSWASSNSMLDIDMPMTPECRQFAVKCKTEGMMGKVKDMFGCDIPYCKDGKYSSSAGLSVWKYDHKLWRKAFSVWQRAQSYGGGGVC